MNVKKLVVTQGCKFVCYRCGKIVLVPLHID